MGNPNDYFKFTRQCVANPKTIITEQGIATFVEQNGQLTFSELLLQEVKIGVLMKEPCHEYKIANRELRGHRWLRLFMELSVEWEGCLVCHIGRSRPQ